MHRVPPTAALLTRGQLRTLGWSDAAVTRAARSGRLVRVRPGFFSPAELAAGPSDRGADLAARAAAAACGGVVSHRSALRLHGLPVVGAAGPPEITLPPRGTSRAVAAKVYRATMADADVMIIDGVPVTSAARTLVDAARHLPTLAAVAALDAGLHHEAVTLSQLDDVVTRCWNWPRIARAQRALRLVDARAESPLESISRVVIGWLGLPAPVPQARIFDVAGRFVGRVDFYWDEFGVAGEADGRGKYDAREILTAEKDRQEDLENLHLAVTRWRWTHATVQRAVLRRRIVNAFERGRARDRSGLRRGWSVRA